MYEYFNEREISIRQEMDRDNLSRFVMGFLFMADNEEYSKIIERS